MKMMKYHPHGSVLFVTLSVEEGLLLLCNPLCALILMSCLARAQFLHPVTISHFVIEATHVHIIFVVDNPDDVSGLIKCFKTESAHMINRFLGRKKRTVWCEGYDSPVILTPERALIAIAYLYANPAKDNLVDTIDQYPGLSSWNMFLSACRVIKCKRIRRPACKKLDTFQHSRDGYATEAKRLEAGAKKSHELVLDPDAWMTAFGITDANEKQRLNTALIRHVRSIEQRARDKRKKENKPVYGRDSLTNQKFELTYRPNRTGQRSLCLAHHKKFRIPFIQYLKELFIKARAIRKKWSEGDFTQRYPPGLYPPCFPKLANAFADW